MIKVIAIVGPTASGKSSLGIYLAQKLGGEVISADSRQVYKGMRIISRADGTYMVGVADPRRQYSAGQYKKVAGKIMRGMHLPIIVGGTGFYIDVLLGRMHAPEVTPNKKLRKGLERMTTKQLVAKLKQLDLASYKRVDLNNRPRLVRAIEIATALGRVPTEVPASEYEVLWLGLKEQKGLRSGVEARLKAGMLAEAKKLRAHVSKKRWRELGFEFELLAQHIDKRISKKELIDDLVRGEEKYAKRQMRWFKRNKNIRWVSGKAEALRLAKGFLSR